MSDDAGNQGAPVQDASHCACACAGADASPANSRPAPIASDALGPLQLSSFRIPGMDCPAEEQMIRLSLAELPTAFLRFDLAARSLEVAHAGEADAVLARLTPLGYGAEWVASRPLRDSDDAPPADEAAERRVLSWLLGLNAMMFVIEILAGWWAHSAGLISDAVDMLADAAVYGVALFAVGRSLAHQRMAAKTSGWLQLALALAVLGEAARRAVHGSAPEELTMVGISLLALAVNVACLLLIARHREQGVHMRASYIFSANDVLANLGVIVAGGLVAWTGRAWPDWIIGLVIGLLVLVGAVRILKLR